MEKTYTEVIAFLLSLVDDIQDDLCVRMSKDEWTPMLEVLLDLKLRKESLEKDWHEWKHSEHCGDCTGDPMRCMQCERESYLQDAEAIVKRFSVVKKIERIEE